MGERRKDALRVNFNRRLKLEFHGTKFTSDTGFQMAEVVVPRKLFQAILERIGRLWSPPPLMKTV